MIRGDTAQQAEVLAEKLAPFVPSFVIYIDRGGRPLGEALAARFGVPAYGIDIGYPLSRLPHSLLIGLVFPIKEVAYRLSRPKLRRGPEHLKNSASRCERVVLVDDTASSGKTLSIALNWLHETGLPREDIRVVVARVGRRASRFVDASVEN